MEKWFNVFKPMLANGCLPTSKPNNLLLYNDNGWLDIVQYKKAISFYREVIKSDPICTDTYMNLGICYDYLGDYSSAIDFFDMALELYPLYPKAWLNKAILPVGHGESILVVEDEDLIREITKKTLKTHRYRVITANDGKEAISLYSKCREKIKVVLMDMMMPIMDGSTSIRELHKINPELKIIAVSGLTEKDKLVKVYETHIHAFLMKPYTTEKLLNTIYDAINTE